MPRITPAHAVCLAGLAYDTWTIFKQSRKIENLLQDNQILMDVIEFRSSQVDYLCGMLDRHEIKITEFDLIAMHNPISIEK